jgi:ferric-dicitrate binding protein FerR (iron transport regulator)
MFDNEHEILAAISSVIGGNPTEEERKIFDAWINESPGNKKFFEIIVQQAERKYDSSEELKERIYAKIKARVLPDKKGRQIKMWIPVSVAASVAIIFSFIFFSLYIRPKTHAKIVFLESTTPFGVKTKLILSDSTVVYLNSGSYLKYPAEFFGSTREIFLKGEAYFEVKKNPERPFIVQTQKVSIKVFGTHFNVKAFPEEDLFETTLIEGSVGLRINSGSEEDIIRLKPNEKAQFSEKTKKIVLQKAEGELEASWKDNKFYFDNSSLRAIVNNLERSYNVPIIICTKELENEVFSGFFDKSRSLYQTLDIMKLHKNYTYKIANDTVLIYSIKND